MSLVLGLVMCGNAFGQQIEVSGIVTDVSRDPIADVSVQVQGTDIRTSTDSEGRYSVMMPRDGVLLFSAIGYRAAAVRVAGETTVDMILEPAIAVLDEIIVTGYTEQRRADITGAVASVDMDAVSKLSSSSVLQRLDGQVAGVTVDNSGNPGGRSTVRIRGISSFQNNDPLYIIDGTPVEDTYINWLNPNDIESIQVLKDASAASIYGSRATNGVVIIETRKRGSSPVPRFNVDVKVGMAQPVRGYNDFLITDALQYHEVVKRSYENAGLAVPENVYGDPNNPSIPAYIWPNDGVNQTQASDVDPDSYSYYDNLIMPGSPGTDWWDAVFGPAMVADANLSVSGSGTSHGYNVSLNYLNQEGTAAYNRFQRGTARVNTQFEIGRFTIGENIAAAYEQWYGGAGDPGGYAEDGILGKNILMQPVVPVYDIGGNFASGKAVTLGNQGNPLKQAWANKDDIGKNIKVFGNVFAGLDITDGLSLNSRFGWNLNEQSTQGYNPIFPENSEPSLSDGISEYYSTFRDWTWTNTLNYSTVLSGRHNFDVLLGQESNESINKFNSSGLNNLVTTDINARYIQDAIGDPETKNVNSGGSKASLMSFFGKVDYNFAERYYLSGTVRRDGSSRLGPDTRWGTFPAFSVGWRISQEPFMSQNQFFTNIMLRGGWGVTGNQAIPAGRVVSQFGGGRDDTFYAIAGSNTLTTGYRQTSLGNANLKWEENESINIGLDLEFFGGAVSLVVDAYQRNTDNLLFDPPVPGTAGVAAPPIVNIGEMKNRGIDFSLGYQGRVGTGTWNVTFNGSHYRNEIVRIDGVQEYFFGPVSTRYGNQVINQVGDPIGSFYGLQTDGFFESDQAVADHATQTGAAPGRIRFVDLDGDGEITADDRTIIGSPHPDFTAGLDFGLAIGAWDFSATVFGTFGNDIFDVQKEFYVFRNFSTNVREDLLEYSAQVDASGNMTNVGTAKYPRLDVNDTFSGQQLSDFYVEDGSYVRLRNLQVGYRLPQSWLPDTRVYVQGENLFTITGYSGLDPALPAANVFGAAGDIRDQYRGVDRGAYPSSRIISFGINASF